MRDAITRADVAHLAQLARLAVTDAELDLFAGQLDVILGAVARVAEVAADDIRPTSHAVPLENVYRKDVVRPSLPRDACWPARPRLRTTNSAYRRSWRRSHEHAFTHALRKAEMS